MLDFLSPAAEKRWHDSLVPLVGTKGTIMCLAGKNPVDQPTAKIFAMVLLANQTKRVLRLLPLPNYTYASGQSVVLRLSKNFDTHDHRCVYQLMAYPV